MIKIIKGTKPQILEDNATQWTKEYLACLNSNQTPSDVIAYRYRHPDIKNALEAETHGKCAYCESIIKPTSFGDIEHILPKKKTARPELYVEWTNLTLACEVCNRINKKDYYDPQNPLINPYNDDPNDYFIMLGPMITYKNNNPKAFITERVLNLNRGDLVVRRSERLKEIDKLLLHWSRETDFALKGVLENEIRKEYAPDKEYSTFVRQFVKAKGFPV